jgi:hypothetical protein
MSDQEFQAEANYLARRRLYQHLARLCDARIARDGPSPVVGFWKGVALGMAGETSEAVFLFEQLAGGTMVRGKSVETNARRGRHPRVAFFL